MNQQERKLIAIDLDGTLLTRGKTISPRTKHALLQAKEQGHHVVIAT
ncbi:MAG: HAD hydrolase family protein, partial [Tumebacillaceae bacterium]